VYVEGGDISSGGRGSVVIRGVAVVGGSWEALIEVVSVVGVVCAIAEVVRRKRASP
jgi:hypothetical protein